MKVSVGQFDPTGNVSENLSVMRSLAEEAKAGGAELVLFPEESMFTVGKVEGGFAEAVEASWSTFVQQLSFIAAQVGLAVIAGGYEASGEPRPYNTLVVVDATGRIAATYRKLHLYDAFSYQESAHIKAGDGGPVLVELGGLKVGVMTCYDLRFPEMARALAVEGADLICVAAAWFKGDHKVEHWETLLKARAIENTCWVAAAGTSSDHTVGHSAILDPMGVPQDWLGDEPRGLVTVDVTRRRIDEVREFLPVLRNRRLAAGTTIVEPQY
ncbi:carbon-nitrogen hydrolase family protein [Arthrobacter mobilis]|uniref:Carbon-nitrogen hydrolase family protein n=1 Tax=Arthrobacter mobilis TaxID=2724944 RepID=A0A7X6HEM3_9MICC|nr:carbon-nitrogen hydrolase family protein [Arthrobacter mobilis]NKX54990.1 carbon-nitrogen hydrolase family protein [Arthrobacter mobilis]